MDPLFIIIVRAQKALERLFPSCSDQLLTRVVQCSRDDLRQMCLTLWIYGDKWKNSGMEFSSNDPFWGIFHMIKKILLAKRYPGGQLENDFDSLFIDNRITVQEALDFVDANFVDYFGDIQDCAEILDDFVTIDQLGHFRHRGGRREEKGGEDLQSLSDRLRFIYLGYATAVRNSHPTDQIRRFTAVASPQSRAVQNLIRIRREECRQTWIRFCEVMECHVTFEEFLLLYPTLLSEIEKKTFVNIGWREEKDKWGNRRVVI